MDLNIIFGIATSLALGIAIYEWKQNRKNSKKIDALEQGLVLNSFKLKKAMEYYEQGDYKSSLEAFRAFAKESDDRLEMFESLKKIFWSETKKIFPQVVVKGWSPNMLITAIIGEQGPEENEYDSFVLNLITLYEDTFDKKSPSFKVVVLLTNRDYDALESDGAIDSLRVSNSKKSNEAYREFVKSYCSFMKNQIGECVK